MIPSGNQTWLARKSPIYFDALPSELNLHRYFRFRISQFISESIPPVLSDSWGTLLQLGSPSLSMDYGNRPIPAPFPPPDRIIPPLGAAVVWLLQAMTDGLFLHILTSINIH